MYLSINKRAYRERFFFISHTYIQSTCGGHEFLCVSFCIFVFICLGAAVSGSCVFSTFSLLKFQLSCANIDI